MLSFNAMKSSFRIPRIPESFLSKLVSNATKESNLEAFRNLESVRLSFVGDRNFLLGPNGQGKTNLLEAIGMSGSLRSFRKSGMEGLVQEGKKKAQLFFRFCDDFGTEHEILLGFQGKGQKDLELNGEKITKLEIILVFSPRLHCLPVIFVW